MADSEKVPCPHCDGLFKNVRCLQSHMSKYHRDEKRVEAAAPAAPAVPAAPVAPSRPAPAAVTEGAWAGSRFGSETIEPILQKLTNAQLRALLLYPEDAICTDLPNLVWFNLDHPENQTVSMEGGGIVIRAPRGTTGRWRPEEATAVLRASFFHFKKVMDMCRGTVYRTLTPVQQGLLNEYARALEEAREIHVSP
jgi:hypothetical protein